MLEQEEISEEGFDNEELYEHFNLKIDKGQTLVRIDKFLLDRLPHTSRNRVQVAIRNGNILVNGKTIKPNYRIKPLDEVSIVLPHPVKETELIPENIPIDIVYEDDTFLILNKQAGLVVHPGFGNYSGTLVNGLAYHFNNLPQAPGSDVPRPGLVHRIDKLTTGLMVIAKTDDALSFLSKQFFDRNLDRRYYALVWGNVEKDEGEIEGHVGRSIKDRKMFDVFPDGSQGKYALTRYKVVQRFGYVTLVECKLETGRTHQIRVHFKHIKHPLFGDLEYGGDKVLYGTTFSKYKQFVENCFQLLPRQALHAKTLEFTHPKTGEWVAFNSELPNDMQQVIEKWRIYAEASNL